MTPQSVGASRAARRVPDKAWLPKRHNEVGDTTRSDIAANAPREVIILYLAIACVGYVGLAIKTQHLLA